MPAPGQGCLGLEDREEDQWIREILETIKDESSDSSARAERSFLQALGGNCLVPLASLTKIIQKEISMQGLLLDLTGETIVTVKEVGSCGPTRTHWRQAGGAIAL